MPAVLLPLERSARNAYHFSFRQQGEFVAKIGFISLGCPKNLVDSEVMAGLLQR